MSIPLPDLVNKNFEDLIGEMVASIPKYNKDWTNFNPSDPGITILELLAWVAETLIYRTDRIPEELSEVFLQLVAGSEELYDSSDDPAYHEIRQSLQQLDGFTDWESIKGEAQRFLNSRYRAVTLEDFRELALEADKAVRRVEVFLAKNSSNEDQVELIVIPEYPNYPETDRIIERVRDYLKPRCLIGTPFTVRKAEYTDLNLKITVVCTKTAAKDQVVKKVTDEIKCYLDGIKGGPNRTGWPYDRSLMVYDLFYIIEKIEGVRHVPEILVRRPGQKAGEPFTEFKVRGLINLIDPPEIEVGREDYA